MANESNTDEQRDSVAVQRLVRGRGEAIVGDVVEWSNCDRRGVRTMRGTVVGDARRNTHLRVRTEKGIREVHRFHATPIHANDKDQPPKPAL